MTVVLVDVAEDVVLSSSSSNSSSSSCSSRTDCTSATGCTDDVVNASHSCAEEER